MVRFRLDGVTHELRNPDPTLTLLRWLRTEARRTGTKEGCAEGDCGACTVAVAAAGEKPRAVNACILFMPMLDGMTLWTVESLARDGAPHPIQKALVDHHGSQCGFCTPGFVMSLFAHLGGEGGLGGREISDALAGNLCRCTGYGPIISAAQNVERTAPPVGDLAADSEPLAIESDGGRKFFAPRSEADLASLLEQFPSATLVAGATDVGLWVTKQHRDLETLISVAHVPELCELHETDNAVELGAAVTYSEAHAALARFHPDMGELLRRLGGVQVRNCGTIGGNIANGSPIGDMPPALIAAGATLVLRKSGGERRMPLENYFIAYSKQDREPGEYVARIVVPKVPADARFAAYKVSKRFDQDISAVCAGFRVRCDGARVIEARLAFGGMAATPKRAANAEAALTEWSDAAIARTMDAVEQDFQPLTDQRGSSAYRLEAARNLLRRFYLESQGVRACVLDTVAVDA
ncbi:xanthine dehydrogenase [alpha proteobacterium U9-1i]|nr:xanthine dehydrogenase [alpha proteobacterium U9-1i]